MIQDNKNEEQVLVDTAESPSYIQMDFNLPTAEARVKKVEEIIANTPPERLTQRYLNKLADYIVMPLSKEEKKQKNILTDNMMVTVNKRETSFEGLVGKMENGEDGIYNMITNDKNIIFQPKNPVSPKDLEEIPEMKELYDAIKVVEEDFKTARGMRKYNLKKQLKEMWQDMYEIKKAYRKPIYSMNLVKNAGKIDLSEKITITEDGKVISTGLINFYDEKSVSALLCNYCKLKEDNWERVSSDIKWLMEDFDALVERTLKEKYPLYYDLVIYKIDGKQNIEIQQLLNNTYNIKHSVEYISSLWRNKIPKLIVEQATKEYIEWYYTNKEKGQWKKCNSCGQYKLANNLFFSKNKTSKDGWYSICKECRSEKYKAKKK